MSIRQFLRLWQGQKPPVRLSTTFHIRGGGSHDGDHTVEFDVPKRFVELLEASEGRDGCSMFFEYEDGETIGGDPKEREGRSMT